MEPTNPSHLTGKRGAMSLPVRKTSGKGGPVESLDLYEAGDQLFPQTDNAISSRQRWTRSASTPQDVYLKIVASGFQKPTIQLAMLLWLERQDQLSVGGKRRLHKMLASQPTPVHIAAVSRSELLGNDPRFEMLACWVNRPLSLRGYHRKSKRRIGVGYRDKGSTLPHDKQGRREGPDDAIFLGEHMEFIWSLVPIEVALLVQDYGHLFNHLDGGWWVPDHRLKALLVVRRLLTN